MQYNFNSIQFHSLNFTVNQTNIYNNSNKQCINKLWQVQLYTTEKPKGDYGPAGYCHLYTTK